MAPNLILVRPTVHLLGVRPGEEVWVNPKDPQIARWLRGSQLMRVERKPVSRETRKPKGNSPGVTE
jgi:hypothetical protein